MVLGIPHSKKLVESCNITSKASCGGLLASILGVIDLKCAVHRAYIYRESAWYCKDRKWEKTVDLGRQKEDTRGQEKNLLQKGMRNGSWITAIIHGLNDIELSL